MRLVVIHNCVYLCHINTQNYGKKMTLTANTTKKIKTLYQQIADKHGVTPRYVGKIARCERTPTKKLGLAVKNDLDSLFNQ